ncbi:MAG: adenylosuccinate lyase [Candidatus Levybacteria bacterium]|nr:adenylosuccinate lyase [Candidatus Levybacteria bacterium]
MAKQNLPFSNLSSISPLDGRYRNKIEDLSSYVSEFTLIKTRVEVEIKYLIALSKLGVARKLTSRELEQLNSIYQNFSFEDAQKVKELEEKTRHDVKAMERTFRDLLLKTTLSDILEFVHFGITSEDINNLSQRLILKRAVNDVCFPAVENLINELVIRADAYKKIPMLARTHGQPAVPTTLGKELIVFASRLSKETKKLKSLKLSGKLSGAVGNFNALNFAYPKIDWISFSKEFVLSLGFEPNLATTQINTYEDIIEYFQNIQRINNIIIDFDQDMWRYISDNWFVQENLKDEVGSSTMPQKVNPIDFENSEGNLGLTNSIIEFMSRKLPISRLQRDLSDSTVIRNIGTVLGYSLVGYKSAMTGLSRVKPNTQQLKHDLENDYSILTEGVQTLLRKANISDPYSLIADLTRGQHLTKEKWQDLVDKLNIDLENKKRLENLTPSFYIGLAVELTEKAIKEIKEKK